jgi:hypothetical protein
VLCELNVVEKIKTNHRKKYNLPYPGDQWIARCRQCGRHYLLSGHQNPAGEKAELYPHFFYHSIISWNQLRRKEAGLGPVRLDELEAYWQKNVAELSWEAAMVNAFETDQEERSRPSKSRRSFVDGAKHCDLQQGAAFRLENDLSFPIPCLLEKK